MRVCLYEDRGVANLEPLTLTRPVFDLVCGQTSLGSKQAHYFAPCEVGALVRPYLADLVQLQQPAMPINDLAWLRAEPIVLVNGRWLPPAGTITDLTTPCVAMNGNEIAYAIVGPDQLLYCSTNTLEDCLETWKQTLPHRAAGGQHMAYLWDLVQHNAEQIHRDFEQQQASARCQTTSRPTTFALVGPPERLLIDPTAQIDPLVVADTRRGPVVIDREAVVHAFSRLEGPCYIGPQTQVLSAKIRAGTTLGPNCRVGGEIEASIIQGHSNKYHDGFLGHSYVGAWVNCGAGTQNSDLRNDYGEVTVTVDGRSVATGSNKIGCFLGDHVKTGLGTLLNTGTNVGVFCNLLPAGLFPPKYVPSFCSWWRGALTDNAEMAKLLATAAEVMRRRDCTLTEVYAVLVRTLFEQSAGERRRTLRDSEQRPLRRSA